MFTLKNCKKPKYPLCYRRRLCHTDTTQFENYGAKDLVKELDKWIIGQPEAKKAVAIAMRSRWRRNNLPNKQLQKEIIPKNILMIGSSGVGKTEIARRMAKLTGAPFVKVEATKYTEVGFKGSDVEQMIEDLMHVALRLVTEKEKARLLPVIQQIVEDKLLNLLIGENTSTVSSAFREDIRLCLKNKQLEDVVISNYEPPIINKMQGSGKNSNPLISLDLQGLNKDVIIVGSKGEQFDVNALLRQVLMKEQNKDNREREKGYTIADIRAFETSAEEGKQISGPKLVKQAIYEAENYGIIFIDEFDKIAKPSTWQNSLVSSEGVQRDLLPIIEGTKVQVQKFGDIDTSKMLFIGSGAFLISKPSNLIAELQGRLPIRVKLANLSEDDLYRILTEPEIHLIKQHKSLLKTEDIDLRFTDEALHEIAKFTFDINKTHENIGARRLSTILEKVLEEYSYNASKYKGTVVTVDKDHIENSLKQFTDKQDLKRFIL